MQTTTPTSAKPAQKANILLVDDHDANLLALEAILDDLGQNLVRARSGEEALKHLLRDDFAVVLLDVRMQGLDGFETAKIIRSREKNRHTPIIFLTAYDTNRLSVEEAYALGSVDYLVKPLVPVILRAKVAGFVELYEKAAQIKRQAEQIRQMERRGFERKLAEENARLRESESRKTAILETALDCIITINHEGKVVEFNPAAEQTFGFSRAQIVGRELAECIIPPGQRQRHRRGLAHYLATGQESVLGRRLEMQGVRADGSEFPVELAVTRIPTDGPPLFTAYLRDITERKRAEGRRNARLAVTQVLAQAATLREAAPQILEAMCKGLGWDVGALWTLDRAAAVLRCAEVWHTPAVSVRHFEATTRERCFPAGTGLPGRVWSAGQPVWIPDVTRDDNFPRADVASQEGLHGAFGCPVRVGTEFIGVIEFFSQALKEPDADLLEMMTTIGGQVGQFLERTHTEEALRESEQRFARFMHHLPGLAWIKDLEGRYVYANDAAVKAFGKAREELYGKTDEGVFPPGTAAQFSDNDRRALSAGAGLQVVETLEHDGGTVHHSLVNKFPILGPDGQASLVGGMAIDITDRLRAEEALREADRLKDEFLAMLAHELRNPLAPVRNALYVMRQPGVDKATVEQVRAMAERQVQHMARLLDDLLDVSRITRGKIELRHEVVDLGSVLHRTVEAVRPLIEERRHQLTISLQAGSLRLEADPTRLEQILINLLTNAAKYTDAGGQIGVTAEREAGDIVVRVRDTGIGIPPEMLTRVFDLFVQAPQHREHAQSGVGIGLTLVKQLVELHTGTVAAHSAGLGHGSEFVVRLPALPMERDGPHAPAQAGSARPGAAPSRRVLVVDDNQDAANSLALLLRLEGQDVQVVYDGVAALERAAAFLPQIVLLDLGMPGIDGYEVARQLRKQAGLEKTLLVALTGWGQEEDRRRSQATGFHMHLVKPLEPGVLQSLLMRSVS